MKNPVIFNDLLNSRVLPVPLKNRILVDAAMLIAIPFMNWCFNIPKIVIRYHNTHDKVLVTYVSYQ